MQRHEFDGRIMDFTWKQNRLSKDKEALKNSMLNVIRKKPKIQNAAEEQRVSLPLLPTFYFHLAPLEYDLVLYLSYIYYLKDGRPS